MVMRESHKKTKVKTFTDYPKLPCSSLWFCGQSMFRECSENVQSMFVHCQDLLSILVVKNIVIAVSSASSVSVLAFFQAGLPFSIKNAKFSPVLANLGNFVANICTSRCRYGAEVAWCTKLDKYQVYSWN